MLGPHPHSPTSALAPPSTSPRTSPPPRLPGLHRQSVELLLPLIGATDLDDWPGGIRQQFKARRAGWRGPRAVGGVATRHHRQQAGRSGTPGQRRPRAAQGKGRCALGSRLHRPTHYPPHLPPPTAPPTSSPHTTHHPPNYRNPSSQAALPLMERLLSRLRRDAPDLGGRLAASILDDADAVGAWVGDSLAAVLFPTAETFKEVLNYASSRDATGLTLLINPQWRGGQLVSDWGIGPWRARREAQVASFEQTFCLAQAGEVALGLLGWVWVRGRRARRCLDARRPPSPGQRPPPAAYRPPPPLAPYLPSSCASRGTMCACCGPTPGRGTSSWPDRVAGPT